MDRELPIPKISLPGPGQIEGLQPYAKIAALEGRQDGKGTGKIIIRFQTTSNPEFGARKRPLVSDSGSGEAEEPSFCAV